MSKALFWNYKKIELRPLWAKIILPILLAILATYAQTLLFPHDNIIGLYCFFVVVLIISACYGGAKSMLCASIITSFIILSSFYFHEIDQTEKIITTFFILETFAATGIVSTIENAFKNFNQKGLKFKKMVEQTGEAFIILNEEYFLTYHTSAVRSLCGRSEEELRGHCFLDLLHPEDKKTFRYDLLKLVAHKSDGANWIGRIKNVNGDDLWVEITISDLLNDDIVNGFIIHINNVDGQVKKDMQKDDFVYMATHELKSPITVLRGYFQILSKVLTQQPEPEKHLQMLEKMDLQLNRLMFLISDMLDAIKIKAGELNHNFAMFDINDCIRNCLDGIMTAEPNCEINCILDNSISKIVGDKDRIHQVLNNFLSNALKYSPDNKKIEVRSVKEDKCIKITVKDFGIGIPDGKLSQIFERFYRVDSLPRGVFEGLGLGLFICKEIVKRHNGNIGVSSKEQEGSEFWFTLPLINNGLTNPY